MCGVCLCWVLGGYLSPSVSSDSAGVTGPLQPTCLAEFKQIKSIKCSSMEEGTAVLQLGLSGTPQVRRSAEPRVGLSAGCEAWEKRWKGRGCRGEKQSTWGLHQDDGSSETRTLLLPFGTGGDKVTPNPAGIASPITVPVPFPLLGRPSSRNLELPQGSGL